MYGLCDGIGIDEIRVEGKYFLSLFLFILEKISCRRGYYSCSGGGGWIRHGVAVGCWMLDVMCIGSYIYMGIFTLSKYESLILFDIRYR